MQPAVPEARAVARRVAGVPVGVVLPPVVVPGVAVATLLRGVRPTFVKRHS